MTLDIDTDPNFVGVVLANETSPAAIASGNLGGPPLASTFPITSISATNILHSGGVSLTQDEGMGEGMKVLNLLDFDINVTDLIVSGFVTLNGDDVGILPQFSVGEGLALSLTAGAAGALNAVFGPTDPAFFAGLSVGTASFVAAVPEPSSLALLGLGLAGLVLGRRHAVG